MQSRRAFALWLFLFCLISPLAMTQDYKVTDLGQLEPTAINNLGVVAGNLNGHAFLWTPLGRRDLGTLTGGTFSSAAAINDFGEVTGTADGPGTVISPFNLSEFPNAECRDLYQPFVWKPGKGMQGVSVVAPPDSAAFDQGNGWCSFDFYGAGINDRGQIVGYDIGPDFYMWALLWTNAEGMNSFGGSWPPTMANGVSNTGQIVGQNSPNVLAGIGHATSWKRGVATDLGTLGGGADVTDYGSSANGVNDKGQVVGWSTTAPIATSEYNYYACVQVEECPIHAVLWTKNGGILDLGTLPGDALSVALNINLFGQVIGSSGNTTAPLPYYFEYLAGPITVIGHPFIWSTSSGMQDLNSLISANSGWVLNSATGINFWGQIVGSGTLNGEPHGFLLTPQL